MEDAQPTANALKNAVDRVARSRTAQSCARVGYKGLVETVGVGLALSRPVARVTKRWASKMWKAIEKTAGTE